MPSLKILITEPMKIGSKRNKQPSKKSLAAEKDAERRLPTTSDDEGSDSDTTDVSVRSYDFSSVDLITNKSKVTPAPIPDTLTAFHSSMTSLGSNGMFGNPRNLKEYNEEEDEGSLSDGQDDWASFDQLRPPMNLRVEKNKPDNLFLHASMPALSTDFLLDHTHGDEEDDGDNLLDDDFGFEEEEDDANDGFEITYKGSFEAGNVGKKPQRSTETTGRAYRTRERGGQRSNRSRVSASSSDRRQGHRRHSLDDSTPVSISSRRGRCRRTSSTLSADDDIHRSAIHDLYREQFRTARNDKDWARNPTDTI